MKKHTTFALFAIAALLCFATVLAHPFTFKGTVVAAAPTKISVTIVDAKTNKPVVEAFEIDKDTKIFRGDRPVTFAAAQIQKDEAIAITVDLDNGDDLADVIRLPAKK